MSSRHRRKSATHCNHGGPDNYACVNWGYVSCFNLGLKPVIDILAKIYMGCCFVSVGDAGYLTKKFHEEESSTK